MGIVNVKTPVAAHDGRVRMFYNEVAGEEMEMRNANYSPTRHQHTCPECGILWSHIAYGCKHFETPGPADIPPVPLYCDLHLQKHLRRGQRWEDRNEL